MAYRTNLDISPRSTIKGGIQLFLNWTARADDPDQTEPAMIFRKIGGTAIVVLPLSALHNFVQSSGHADLAIGAMALQIASDLGFAAMDRQAGNAVADLILDNADDLAQMFSEPTEYLIAQELKRPQGELSVRLGGETILERVVAV